MSHTLPGADQKPTAAECAVRAMLYARAIRSLKKRLLPGRRRGLLRTQGLRGWKVRRATTGTQTLLSSGTRLKHHGRQVPGSLQGKLSQPDGNDTAKDYPPDPAGPSPGDPSPEASGPSPKPAGVEVSEAPQTSSPCPSADGGCSLPSPSPGPQPRLSNLQASLRVGGGRPGWSERSVQQAEATGTWPGQVHMEALSSCFLEGLALEFCRSSSVWRVELTHRAPLQGPPAGHPVVLWVHASGFECLDPFLTLFLPLFTFRRAALVSSAPSFPRSRFPSSGLADLQFLLFLLAVTFSL